MSQVRGRSNRWSAGAAELGALARSLLQVAAALVASPFRLLSPRASEYVITGCALWALVCPLLLWISWSRTGFLVLIASAAIAVSIIYLLILLHPDDPF